MTLEEFESRQRYDDYQREVQQEQLYRQARASQAKENITLTQKLNKWAKMLILSIIKIG